MHLMHGVSGIVRLLLLSSALVTVGCATATNITATVHDNPLQRVAQAAQEDWTVEQVDENTLHLRDVWPIHSFFALGYSASHVNLFYDTAAKELDLQYFFESYQLWLLFIPFSLDAEPGFVGVALKPIMNGQIEDILRWSGATLRSRRAVDRSQPFPQR